MAKDKPAKKKMSKSQFFQAIADETEMKKADVVKVFDAMHGLIHKELGPKGGGEITLPGIAKLAVTRIKADKGGVKKPNPFKPGEFIVTKPKAARTKLKARGLKAFLDSITAK